ncbi:hypothetical protein [Lewinella sp. W8]|uniref:hypothetical protein n=1 Tax=Lewinella sp. W8 TaxID=2528208 RepID=UPI001068A003|nr:hypothetical protein [Lewinella sp. W8]MTB50413.1 hypothetical protein [Lewinella sp. W8]
MARIAHPSFRLFSRPLEPFDPKPTSDRATRIARGRNIPKGINMMRWTHEANFGLPRQPFLLWRHRNKFNYQKVITNRRQVDGQLTVNNPGGYVYHGLISVDLSSGQTLSVTPLGPQGIPIPGATKLLTLSGTYFFNHPFTSAYSFTGRGVVREIRVYYQTALINSPNWELMQRVGLPLDPGSIDPSAYDTSPQGMVAAPMAPRQFHEALLGLAGYLQEPLPPSTDPGVSATDWLPPPAADFLFDLEQFQGGILPHIRKCLEQCDDASPDPQQRQPAYLSQMVVDGLRQEGYPGNIDPGTALIPVVSTTLLAALMDHYVGIALGYGTYDYSGVNQERLDYFYMVTNTFTIKPNFPGLPEQFTIKQEYAALAEHVDRPATPLQVRSQRLHQNRPLTRDGNSTEAVEISCRAPAFPVSYGLFQASGGQMKVLNTNRGLGNSSYQPAILNVPTAENAVEQRIAYVLPNAPIPLAGSENRSYYLAARDIFGRWSGYGKTNYLAEGLSTQPPGMISVKLEHDPALPNGNSSQVATRLLLDVSWDWTERSPEAIEIAGGFYPADRETALPNFTDRLALTAANGNDPVVRITFSGSGVPQVSGSNQSVVELAPSGSSPDPNIRRYRVTVDNVVASFPGPLDNPAPPPANNLSRIAYVARARAQDAVRAGTAVWSGWTAPVSDRMDDPRPPVKLNLPATINWTSLPDATKVARGTLSWPAVTRAVGYVVWEASETAIRTTLGLPQDPNDSLVERATELRDALNDPNNDRDSLRAFVRLNRDPLRTTSVQVNLPGASEVLFLYRVSAMTSANVESERSNVVFFAVPQQKVPGPPVLRVRPQQKGVPGMEVVVLDGAGPEPAGFKLYRVRKRIASNVVQMKGLPVYPETAPEWQSYQLTNLDGSTSPGKKLLDPVASPSWEPYYYQAVAVGPEDRPEGLWQSISTGSPTVEAYFPPMNPPALQLSRQRSLKRWDCHTATLETDAPFQTVQGKFAQLELLAPATSPNAPPKMRTIFSAKLSELPVMDRRFSGRHPAPFDPADDIEVGVFPERDSIFLRVHEDYEQLAVRLTDPLGRSTSLLIDFS